jgi:hypothetical protein
LEGFCGVVFQYGVFGRTQRSKEILLHQEHVLWKRDQDPQPVVDEQTGFAKFPVSFHLPADMPPTLDVDAATVRYEITYGCITYMTHRSKHTVQ